MPPAYLLPLLFFVIVVAELFVFRLTGTTYLSRLAMSMLFYHKMDFGWKGTYDSFSKVHGPFVKTLPCILRLT